jgi:molecular chaperone GrpE (heat shock protein)
MAAWERTRMTRRGPSARAAALRRAQQAKAQRDAERTRRETQIEAALADYYQATAEAEQIRSATRRKADQITAEAEQAAAKPLTAACEAVRRLKNLVGGTAEVASLCGITTAAVREILAAAPQASDGPPIPVNGEASDASQRTP